MVIVKVEIYMIGVLVLATAGSCAMNPGTKEVTANNSSPTREQNKSVEISLRNAWEDRIKGLNKQSGHYPSQKMDALESVLKQVPEEQVKNEFEQIALSAVGYSDLDEYQQTFVQVLIMRKVKEQDRAALVALFSSKAPEFFGAAPMVIYLPNSSIPDPLLVLFESYNRTTNIHTKKDLLEILNHAFRSVREKLTSDDEFVSQSKQWYLQNHAKLELNPYYHPYSSFPDQQELFVEKAKRQDP